MAAALVGIVFLGGGCSYSVRDGRTSSSQPASPEQPTEPVKLERPGQLVRTGSALEGKSPHTGPLDLTTIADGEEVTILVRNLTLHLGPPTTFTFEYNPFDGDPCGTTLCYRVDNVIDYAQYGNCWVETGPPVHIVVLRNRVRNCW